MLQRRVEERSVALLHIQQVQDLVCPLGTRLTSYVLKTRITIKKITLEIKDIPRGVHYHAQGLRLEPF
jgi:hypothetical protein